MKVAKSTPVTHWRPNLVGSNEHLKNVINNVINEDFDEKPPANISNGPSEELGHHSNTKTAAAHNHHLGHNGDGNNNGEDDGDDDDD